MNTHIKESNTIQLIALGLCIMIPTTIYFGTNLFFPAPNYTQAREAYLANNASEQTQTLEDDQLWQKSPEFTNWQNQRQHQSNIRNVITNGCMIVLISIHHLIASPYIAASVLTSAILLQCGNIFLCIDCPLANETIFYIPLKIIRLTSALLCLAIVLYCARNSRQNKL